MTTITPQEKIRCWELVEELTAQEGDTVTILCENPDPGPQPLFAIVCNGWWTDWEDKRFQADTMLECLTRASNELAEATLTLMQKK